MVYISMGDDVVGVVRSQWSSGDMMTWWWAYSYTKH